MRLKVSKSAAWFSAELWSPGLPSKTNLTRRNWCTHHGLQGTRGASIAGRFLSKFEVSLNTGKRPGGSIRTCCSGQGWCCVIQSFIPELLDLPLCRFNFLIHFGVASTPPN